MLPFVGNGCRVMLQLHRRLRALYVWLARRNAGLGTLTSKQSNSGVRGQRHHSVLMFASLMILPYLVMSDLMSAAVCSGLL